jgi:hypothetical protein
MWQLRGDDAAMMWGRQSGGNDEMFERVWTKRTIVLLEYCRSGIGKKREDVRKFKEYLSLYKKISRF